MKPTYEEWFASKPPEIQEAIRRFPGDTCYRLKSVPGHYLLEGYTESNPVTLTVFHASDSTLPGIKVFGIPAEDLEHCGCGKADPPTDKQIKRMRARLKVERETRQN